MTKNLNVAPNAVPVGFIRTWHKTLTGTPTLPSDWQECDGTAITNTKSPMYGENTPNMSSNAWVFGNTTSSNTANTNASPNHTHSILMDLDSGKLGIIGTTDASPVLTNGLTGNNATNGNSFQMVFIIKVI